MSSPPEYPPHPARGAPRPDNPTGALAWGLGLLLFAFPIVGSLAAGVVMAVTGRSMRHRGEQRRHGARF